MRPAREENFVRRSVLVHFFFRIFLLPERSCGTSFSCLLEKASKHEIDRYPQNLHKKVKYVPCSSRSPRPLTTRLEASKLKKTWALVVCCILATCCCVQINRFYPERTDGTMEPTPLAALALGSFLTLLEAGKNLKNHIQKMGKVR